MESDNVTLTIQGINSNCLLTLYLYLCLFAKHREGYRAKALILYCSLVPSVSFDLLFKLDPPQTSHSAHIWTTVHEYLIGALTIDHRIVQHSCCLLQGPTINYSKRPLS